MLDGLPWVRQSQITAQVVTRANGPSEGGLTPISTGLRHSPVDAFNNRAGTLASLGYSWTFEPRSHRANGFAHAKTPSECMSKASCAVR